MAVKRREKPTKVWFGTYGSQSPVHKSRCLHSEEIDAVNMIKKFLSTAPGQIHTYKSLTYVPGRKLLIIGSTSSGSRRDLGSEKKNSRYYILDKGHIYFC